MLYDNYVWFKEISIRTSRKIGDGQLRRAIGNFKGRGVLKNQNLLMESMKKTKNFQRDGGST